MKFTKLLATAAVALGLATSAFAQDKTKAGVITDIINTKQGTFGLDIYEIYFVHFRPLMFWVCILPKRL